MPSRAVSFVTALLRTKPLGLACFVCLIIAHAFFYHHRFHTVQSSTPIRITTVYSLLLAAPHFYQPSHPQSTFTSNHVGRPPQPLSNILFCYNCCGREQPYFSERHTASMRAVGNAHHHGSDHEATRFVHRFRWSICSRRIESMLSCRTTNSTGQCHHTFGPEENRSRSAATTSVSGAE